MVPDGAERRRGIIEAAADSLTPKTVLYLEGNRTFYAYNEYEEMKVAPFSRAPAELRCTTHEGHDFDATIDCSAVIAVQAMTPEQWSYEIASRSNAASQQAAMTRAQAEAALAVERITRELGDD